MKTDRLIALTVYLLCHETVSAQKLAERFEVSKRTIVRDMEALSLAGIPVVSLYGAGGGYCIQDGFKVLKQIASAEDWRNVIAALKGLDTAVGSRGIKETLEKTLSAVGDGGQRIFLNLGAAREGDKTDEYLRTMERAIAEKRPLEMGYADARGAQTLRVVEPVALTYQWYAWYLAAYCRLKGDYRLFKLPRVTSLRPVAGAFTREHASAKEVLDGLARSDARPVLQVKLLCKKEARQQAMEYLHCSLVEELENGDAILRFCAPMERMWFSILMGFGAGVRVLEPEAVKERLAQCAGEVLALYREGEG